MLWQFGDVIFQEKQCFTYAAIEMEEAGNENIIKMETVQEDKPSGKKREYNFITEGATSQEKVIAATAQYIQEEMDLHFDNHNYRIETPNEHLITFAYCIAGYETDYGFFIRLEDGQGVSLIEQNQRPARRVFLMLLSSY